MTDNTEKYILYIGNLPEETTKQNLQSAFLPFGEIKSTEIVYDQTTNKPKGYGFVEFEEYEDAIHAIDNMNDSEFFGRVIHVTFAREKKPKEGSIKPLWEQEGYEKYRNDDNNNENNENDNDNNVNNNKNDDNNNENNENENL